MKKMTVASCDFCPRHCLVDRTKTLGYCRAPGQIVAAKAMIHEGEEPCLIGFKRPRFGAGAVFFSHCNLRCCFCQNEDISLEGKGKEITEERLGEILLGFQETGANCIDLVTPTPYLVPIVHVLEKIKPRLSIPVVYNCGGYESSEALKLLDGLVDVYLPDLKYFSRVLSKRYSGAEDYFEKAAKALEEMYRQTGAVRFDDRNTMIQGVLVRHLVLPGCYKDSLELMDFLAKAFPVGDVWISLLRQYTPYGKVLKGEFPELNRRLTTFEYEKVVEKAVELELPGYIQNKNSASMEMKPEFDLSGL